MKAIVWLVIIIAAIWIYESSQHNSASVASRHVDSSESSDESSEFDGSTCTVDCSGHEAGYRWAEEKGIDDEDACDTAGENSNSPSFAEGCKAYVNGDPDDSSDDDQ